MYYLLFFFLYTIALLPLWLLYGISDIAFFLLYYIIGYRKKIVWDNLKHAFPEKTNKELFAIRKKNYRSFCDQWIETLKLLSISKKTLNKRITANWEVFHELEKNGKNTYALLGHSFNWEWANVACAWNVRQQFAGIYLPLSSKVFDKLMLKIRSRSGARLISMKALRKGLYALKDKQYILAQMADQNPSVTEVATWVSFMNRETPFFKGTEQMARRAKAAVVFANIMKIKRGYYQIELKKLTDDASKTEEGVILKKYIQLLEEQLQTQPENWMWTHRRWKHAKK